MPVYTVLLYEELVRRKELTDNGLLLPVLSLVLYNGRSEWREALSLEDLVEPLPGVAKLQEELAGDDHRSLQQAALTWLLSRMKKLVGPGVPLPEVQEWTEVESMLEQSVLEWRDSWFQEGVQKGLQKGEATVLLRLLKKKFGSLPAPVHDRIQSASAEQLLDWADRVLTARTLDQVFDPT